MSKREFIRNNRKAIDEVIREVVANPDLKINDREREMWLLNDEGLYSWARQEGVRI